MKIDRVALLFSVLGLLIPAIIFMRICHTEKNTYGFWGDDGAGFFALAVFCVTVFICQIASLILAMFGWPKPAAKGALVMVFATPLLMYLIWSIAGARA